jgi:hypothetical protein
VGFSKVKTSFQDPIWRTWAFLVDTDSPTPGNPLDIVWISTMSS